MSTKLFYKSLSVKNYRGLPELSVEKFKRINVIGGLNSSGKSTLLESMFMLLDLYSPTSIIRPALSRNMVMTVDEFTELLYTNCEKSKPITINSTTHLGKIRLEIIFEKQPAKKVQKVELKDRAYDENSSLSASNMGLTIKYFRDNTLIDIFHHAGSGSSLNYMKEKNSTSIFPQGVLLVKNNFGLPQEAAGQLTKVMQAKKRERLLNIIKLIEPKILNLQVLQLSQQGHASGEFMNDVFLPMGLLGGGASSLLSICLAIMTSPGGAVFLDEFDTAFHYTKIKLVWQQIAKLSKEYNCQIFAATHSSECIKAAMEALREEGAPNDMTYIRLDRVGDCIKPTNYSLEEVESALNEEWEVR